MKNSVPDFTLHIMTQVWPFPRVNQSKNSYPLTNSFLPLACIDDTSRKSHSHEISFHFPPISNYIYIKAETSCENAWGPATWHSNITFNFFYLFPLSFFYCYPISHSNLFLLLYKFSIFYLFLLIFFYCYPIDHSKLLHLIFFTFFH